MKITFEINSGEMVISDPCYDESIDTTAPLPVTNGTWRAHVDKKCGRVAKVSVSCQDHYCGSSSRELIGSFAVDSGQLGFFDKETYRNNDMFSVDHILQERIIDCDGNFYANCCDITLSTDQAGALDHGFVSSTGWGDGEYKVWGRKNKEGLWTEFVVDYMDEEDEDDEEYYE